MEMINVAELLKDCPEGMELDCTNYNGVVSLKGITNEDVYPIEIQVVYSNECNIHTLTKYGQTVKTPYNKCVIFPKGKTTWEGFVPPCKFKDGDIVAHQNHMGTWIGIYHKHDYLNETFSSYCCIGRDGKFWAYFNNDHGYDKTRLATEEEKQKLFDAIKANGYKWNAETKTLDKLIKPIFKVGDKVRHKNNHNVVFTITDIGDDTYSCGAAKAFWFDDQDDYEVIHEPKFKVGDRVRKKGDETATFTISDIGDLYYYCGEYIICNISYQDNYELVPDKFDITTLKPFESRVLVRDSEMGIWLPDFFGCLDNSNECPYMVVGGIRWKYCIPFEGNEHLMGKADDCDEFYKTWE